MWGTIHVTLHKETKLHNQQCRKVKAKLESFKSNNSKKVKSEEKNNQSSRRGRHGFLGTDNNIPFQGLYLLQPSAASIQRKEVPTW
ncbi:hypothetical protein QQ045_001925 [Rhodiola kirilowii]